MNYFLAFIGALAWNFLLFNITKNKSDAVDKDFEFKKYFNKSWDDWAFTVLMSPLVVYYMVDIVALINQIFSLSIPMYSVYCLGAGIIVQLLYVGVAVLMKWKSGLIPEAHKD